MRTTGGSRRARAKGFASAAVSFTSLCLFLERESRYHHRLTYVRLRLQKKMKERKREGRFPQEAPPDSLFRPSSNVLVNARTNRSEGNRMCESCTIIALEGSERRHGGRVFTSHTVISYCRQFTLARPRTEYNVSLVNYASRS